MTVALPSARCHERSGSDRIAAGRSPPDFEVRLRQTNNNMSGDPMNGSWSCTRLLHAVAAIGAVLVFSAGGPPARAAEPGAVIGHVKTVSGEAWIGMPGSAVPAVVGAPVRVGALMKTGPAASLGVTLTDNTVMSFGPGTEVTVDEYLFEPDRGELKLGANITRGTLNFISGLIARMRPEAQTVRTPTGTIGVRGTHFLVKVEDPAK
jgi:hypothetical protein